MTTIKNNLPSLTPDEKRLIDSAYNFEYTYGVGLIFINDSRICWDCTNTVSALHYLQSKNIHELNKPVHAQ
jgi:hypothetical protein